MKFKNEKILYLNKNDNINQYIERLNYICKSYESFLSILAREFSCNKSTETENMIEKYRLEYQNHNIELNLAINELISNELGYLPENMHYSFDFNKKEVILQWN